MPRELKDESMGFSNQNFVSEEKYRSLINNLTDIILEGDSKSIVSYVSPQCYDIIGYKPKEIIGKSALEFIHPDDVLLIAEVIKIAFNTGEMISVPKYRLLHKNGTYIFVSAKGKFIGNVEDRKFIVAIRDITARIKIEQKLYESEEKYEHLFQNSPYGIILLNFSGIIFDVNLTIEKTFGYIKKDYIGTDFFKIPALPSDILPLLKQRFELYKKNKKLEPIELQVYRNDGTAIWVNPQVSLITLANETFIQIIVQDISEKKQAELKIIEAATKYKLISENASDLILIVSENLIIEYVNEEPLFQLSGYSVEEVIGKRALNFIHFDDAKKALKQISESFEQKGRGTIEARIIHKEGHLVDVEIKGSLFHNEKGEPKALLITRDITERKKAEKLILEENKKLLEISQIKSELITTTSHELKTPLNSIFAASQILLSNFRDEIGEESLKFIEMIHRGGQKLKILIENLLDTSKIEAEKFNLNLQEENIVELTINSINDVKNWADRRNINILADHPKELIVLVDRIKIEQVLTNLLSNAIKYTPPFGKIHVKINKEENWNRISIQDSGIGLSKKELKNLFKKFGKIDRFGENPNIESYGSGLGLYISKEIIDLHSGEICVESEGRNMGSTFIIRLPKL